MSSRRRPVPRHTPAPIPGFVMSRGVSTMPISDTDPLLHDSDSDSDTGAGPTASSSTARHGNTVTGRLAVGFGGSEWVGAAASGSSARTTSTSASSPSQTLYLASCRELGVLPIGAVTTALTRTSVSLRHRGVSDSQATAVAAALTENSCVSVLDLHGNTVSDVGATALCEALCCNTSITSLDLGENPLTSASRVPLAATIASSPALSALCVGHLKSDVSFVYDVMLAVRDSPALRHLDVSQCGIRPKSGEAVAVAVDRLSTLNLAWNDLSSGAIPLCDALASPTASLTSLDLSFNALSDDTGVVLGRALSAQSTLTELDVSHNKLGLPTAEALSDGLTTNSTLLALRAGYNPLEKEGGLALLSALQLNVTLTELGIENCIAAGGTDGDAQTQQLWEAGCVVLEDRPQYATIGVEFPERARKMTSASGRGGAHALRRSSVPAARREWSVDQSVFRHRVVECDARAFVDTVRLLGRAFERDWAYSKIQRIIKSDVQRAPVKVVLKDRFPLLREAFRHYAAQGGDPFTMNFSQFTQFRRDCDIDAHGKHAELDTVFVTTNFETVRDHENPSHSFVRFELLEAVVRLAFIMYPPDMMASDGPAVSVETLMDAHVVPHLLFLFRLKKHGQIFSNMFREAKLYTEPVDAAFRANAGLCQGLFQKYAGLVSGLTRKKQFLSMSGWVQMLVHGKVLQEGGSGGAGAGAGGKDKAEGRGGAGVTGSSDDGHDAGHRLARLAFLFSNMTVVDELHRETRLSRRCVHTELTFVEFLECIGRFADAFASSLRVLAGGAGADAGGGGGGGGGGRDSMAVHFVAPDTTGLAFSVCQLLSMLKQAMSTKRS